MRIFSNLLSLFVCLVLTSCSRGGRDGTEIDAENLSKAPSTVVDDANNGVPTAESIRQIATQNLRIGLEGADVGQILKKHGLSQMFVSNSGVSVTELYGTGQLADPVLFVTFRRDDHQHLLVTEWYVEDKIKPQVADGNATDKGDKDSAGESQR